MGTPGPFYQIQLRDREGNPVPDGEIGEVVILPPASGRQPGILCGYLDNEEQYQYVWRGGVYHTGDAAWRDKDGLYWFHGRFDDIIKTGGFRVGPYEVEHVLAVWDSVPRHLGKENKKFVFGQIREGARARDYRSAITWLAQAGLAVPVRRVSKPGMPLAAYADDGAFKLFLLDVGLLGALSGLKERAVIEGSAIFTEFKGSLTEQYVCQQLLSGCGLAPYYWSAENGRSEIDFLVQSDEGTFPIEVKAEENLRSKSLRTFAGKYPDVDPLRFSMSPFRVESWMRNIPLYALQNRKLWAD